MSFSRWFVLTTGIIWVGYGVACAIFPQIIGTLTGIGMDNWPADVEVRAWYLVTELGLGILAFYGWKDPERYLEINLLIWSIISPSSSASDSSARGSTTVPLRSSPEPSTCRSTTTSGRPICMSCPRC